MMNAAERQVAMGEADILHDAAMAAADLHGGIATDRDGQRTEAVDVECETDLHGVVAAGGMAADERAEISLQRGVSAGRFGQRTGAIEVDREIELERGVGIDLDDTAVIHFHGVCAEQGDQVDLLSEVDVASDCRRSGAVVIHSNRDLHSLIAVALEDVGGRAVQLCGTYSDLVFLMGANAVDDDGDVVRTIEVERQRELLGYFSVRLCDLIGVGCCGRGCLE